jgi:hypothetical protein
VIGRATREDKRIIGRSPRDNGPTLHRIPRDDDRFFGRTRREEGPVIRLAPDRSDWFWTSSRSGGEASSTYSRSEFRR